LTLLCADTSSWIAFLAGEAGKDVAMIEQALRSQSLVMAPLILRSHKSASIMAYHS
jgi:hypothetical protein